MHYRIPSRKRKGAPPGKDAAPGKDPAHQGNTVPVQGQSTSQTEVAPRMPHERDESADSQGSGEPTAHHMAELARKDIERGVVDTDKGPVLDETYEKFRDEKPDPTKKFSP